MKYFVSFLKFSFIVVLLAWIAFYGELHFGSVVDLLARSTFSWSMILLSFFLMALHVALVYLSFSQLFRVVKIDLPRNESIGIFLYSNVAKYIPGGVWQAGSRVYALSKLGVQVDKIVVVLSLEVIVSVVLSVIVSLVFHQYWWPLLVSVSFPYWQAVVGFVGLFLFCYITFRFASNSRWRHVIRNGKDALSGRALFSAVLLHLLSFFAFAASYWVCIYAMSDFSEIEFLSYFGVLMAATLVGFFAFFAPAGFGVREGILFSFLLTVYDPGIALFLSAFPRLLSLLVDLFGASFYFVCTRYLRFG